MELIAVVLVGCCEDTGAVVRDWVFGCDAGSAGGVRGPAGEAMVRRQSAR
jgi:hypothetical protein